MQQHAAILPPVATVREGNSRHLDHGLMRVVLMYVYAYVKILNLKIKSTSDSYIRGNVSLKRRDTKLALWVPSARRCRRHDLVEAQEVVLFET